ncbi:hypothetical protein C8J56DRAFT_1033452 [Mycena floridula]|nr:hypothetical protein C8J56DRAFT_1033452 [Mycena floridula]
MDKKAEYLVGRFFSSAGHLLHQKTAFFKPFSSLFQHEMRLASAFLTFIFSFILLSCAHAAPYGKEFSLSIRSENEADLAELIAREYDEQDALTLLARGPKKSPTTAKLLAKAQAIEQKFVAKAKSASAKKWPEGPKAAAKAKLNELVASLKAAKNNPETKKKLKSIAKGAAKAMKMLSKAIPTDLRETMKEKVAAGMESAEASLDSFSSALDGMNFDLGDGDFGGGE